MNAAREAVIAAVRQAIGSGPTPEPISRAYGRSGTRAQHERVDLLVGRLVDYRAIVHRIAPEQLESLLGKIAPGRIGVPPGLAAEWRPLGAVEDHGLTPQELDELDGVVTGCTLAIAETGTLVLSGAADEGRRALTLVPDLHVCIVRPGQIVEVVPEAFEALRESAHRPLTFISGPSATSDIELKRVEGVHGPRQLVVVILEEGDLD